MDAYSIGQYLREAREAKELSLEQVEKAIKIRRHILEAFEQGDFTVTEASPVQIRGFIRNYARFIELDEELMLQYYDSSQQPANRRRPRQRNKTKDKRASQTTAQATATPDTYRTYGEQHKRRPSPLLRFLNLLMMITLAAVAVAVIIFVTMELLDNPETPLITEPTNSIMGDIPPTLTLTPRPTITPQQTVTVEARSQQVYNGQPVLVTLEVRQRCWLRFEADGVELFSGLVSPDEHFVLEYQANNEIFVEASNAAALVVTYNGQLQPTFGGRGQQVKVHFRPNNNVEIISGPGFAPSAEASATQQDTPVPMAGTLLAELTPSNTPGPSPTPSDTPTITNTPTDTLTPSETPTETLTPTQTETPTDTLTPSNTPTATLTPTVTFTPSQTAIVPPRITPTPATPEKSP